MSVNIKDHPRDKYGNYLCTKEHPMPQDHKDLGWIHEDAEETPLDSDYCIEYECSNCGLVFRVDMPD